jgi:hypothetical protein
MPTKNAAISSMPSMKRSMKLRGVKRRGAASRGSGSGSMLASRKTRQ